MLSTTYPLDTTRNLDNNIPETERNEYGLYEPKLSELNFSVPPPKGYLKLNIPEKSLEASTPKIGRIKTERSESPGRAINLKTENSESSCFYRPDLSERGPQSFMSKTGRLRQSNENIKMAETNINGFRLKKCKTAHNIIPFNKCAGRTRNLGKKKGEKTIDPSYDPKFNSVLTRINNLCIPFNKLAGRTNPICIFFMVINIIYKG